MAKIKGPLLSQDAHGSISKIITYSKRRSGSQVRKYNKPLADPSAAQRGQRRLTEFLVAQWQNMSAGDKATWATNARATSLNLSGYHFFLRSAQRDLYTHHGLCLYAHCNEYLNGLIKDISGNGYDGTPLPTYASNCPTIATAKSTRFGRALQFDGIDDYVTFGDVAKMHFGTGPFTIIHWLISDGTQDAVCPIAKVDWTVTRLGWEFRTATPAQINFRMGDGAASQTSGTWALPANTWNCIVFRRYGTTADMLINNVVKGSMANAGYDVDTAQPLVIGGDSWHNRDMKCLIDEVAVYNRKIELAELTTRYKLATS